MTGIQVQSGCNLLLAPLIELIERIESSKLEEFMLNSKESKYTGFGGVLSSRPISLVFLVASVQIEFPLSAGFRNIVIQTLLTLQ